MKDPVLFRRAIQYDGKLHNLIVFGGLHYLRGNSAPHFTLTGEIWSTDKRLRDCVAAGCIHDIILKHFPDLADLARLHLSDIDGKPLHGEANGWYNLAGSLPNNAGERYHRGNSAMRFPLPPEKIDPTKPWPWRTTENRNPMPDECLQMFADHVRVPIDKARGVQQSAITYALESGKRRNDEQTTGMAASGVILPPILYDWKFARMLFGAWITSQHERWKQEAEACIAKHGLVVFGDATQWPLENTENTSNE